MSVINPFCALRPATAQVAQVASHSVESYTKRQIEDILAHNPLSFLHIIYGDDAAKEEYTKHLQLIRTRLDGFIKNRVFVKDPSPCFYLYRQIKNNRHHLGIIGLASVDDYTNGIIRIHEQTLETREQKLTEYLDVCGFNAEPVCLTYPHNNELNTLMRNKELTTPVYDYVIDSIQHSLWLFDTKEETKRIAGIFKNIPYIYIADGHHRAASSARLAALRIKNNPNHTGIEPYNFFSAAIFADDELTIHNYNRVVRDLNGLDTDSFLNAVKKKFDVKPLEGKLAASFRAHESPLPARKGEISLYIHHNWYVLKLKNTAFTTPDAVSNLDVSFLSNNILSPILHLKDLRNDKRIAFIPGIKSVAEIMSYVDSGKMAAAFCLYPVSFEELMAVASSGKEMPPKSTWIEPKLESGMLIYDFQ